MLESFDPEIYDLGRVVSGHTLKHLAAAGGYFIALMLTRRTAATYEDASDSPNSTIISSKDDRSAQQSSKMANDVVYDRSPVVAPRLTGMVLRVLVALLETPLTGALIKPVLIRILRVHRLREFNGGEPPTYLPLHHCRNESLTSSTRIEDVPPLNRRGPVFHYRNTRDFHKAYNNGLVTPEQVAERVLTAISDSNKPPNPMHLFIACNRDDVISQAREATRRYAENRTLGPLDGVPIAVKDEIGMVPYPTTAGTAFLNRQAARRDSTVVARLRREGALLIGKTNMHEIGILPDGVNPHYGAVRNPHNLNHESGGSSSGSATAVAAGLCPAAIGADGGGSIRIPSAFCGVVGLKPTYGRVSEIGAVALDWSVAHLGPIAATGPPTRFRLENALNARQHSSPQIV